MIYRTEKLFNGFASVRSTIVELAIKNKEDLKIVHEKEEMTVPLKKLLNPLQLIKKEFDSKIKPNESYLLYDFKWVPDGAYQPPHIKDSFWKKVGVNKKSELF